MSYDARQSRPFTEAELAQSDAAAAREWNEKWQPAFDAAVEDGSFEAAYARTHEAALLPRKVAGVALQESRMSRIQQLAQEQAARIEAELLETDDGIDDRAKVADISRMQHFLGNIANKAAKS